MASIQHFNCRRALLLIAAAFVIHGFMWCPAVAQNNDRKAARAQLRAQLMKTLFDNDASQEQRLAAGARLQDVNGEEAVGLLKFALDAEQEDALRLAAFQGLRVTPELLSAVLGVVGRPDDGGVILKAGLIDQLRTRFRLPSNARVRNEVHAVLRKVLDDPRAPVRSAAFRILGEANDAAAVKLLAEGLNDPDAAKVPKAEALSLLYRAGPREHFSLFKKFVDDPDPNVLVPVFFALSLDPESRPAVVKRLQDRTTPLAARIAAIEALRFHDQDFASYTIDLLNDGEEVPELRVKAVDALVRALHPKHKHVREADQIDLYNAISRLSAAENAPPELMAKCKTLCRAMEKGFPAIQKLRSNPQ